MMALRFLLGMSEAAFGPGTPYLLSFFYRRHELGLRCGMFVSAAPLANTFAGALAYGITSGHSKLANWRLLFLVEGSPSLIAAVLAWYFLPDHPSTARFLTEEEKEVARARGMRRSGESERSTGIDWRDVGRTVLDAKAWLTALMYFSCNVSFSSLPVFLPTILEEMGFSSINAQGLTAPPYFASFLVTIATTWIADRFQQRGLTIAICSVVGAVGYTLLATTLSVGVRYLGVFLAAVGVFPCIANILPWVLSTFPVSFSSLSPSNSNPPQTTKVPTRAAASASSFSISSVSAALSSAPTCSRTATARGTSAARPSARPLCTSPPSLHWGCGCS